MSREMLETPRLLTSETCRHLAANQVNAGILPFLPGPCQVYRSIDTPASDGSNLVQTVYARVPDWELRLKIGSVCVVVADISATTGLFMDTMVVVQSLAEETVIVKTLPDHKDYTISRHTFLCLNGARSCMFNRSQLPLRLACVEEAEEDVTRTQVPFVMPSTDRDECMNESDSETGHEER
ncbi:hypothetical protein BV25DRAFT_1921441 [Artomyces pyxidatus]|uniref:Uncharacterized protein n=1 Tax=Artomyces pyxidatus TaxID=48021 RepID=A0ACB8SH68_9AGAM|nr:hypothetical protein BV25DRAFT_1921441 [Artomyces pyxidatus]